MNRLFCKDLDESPSRATLLMTRGAPSIIRITGGCGFMDKDEEYRMMSFGKALEGFEGVVMGGGTRMVYKNDMSEVRPGITEMIPYIKKLAPHSTTVGLIPRIEGHTMVFLPDGRIAFNDASAAEYVTVMQHENDISIMVQKTADVGAKWEDEYRTALQIMNLLRQETKFSSLTLFYNGGAVSRKEFDDTLKLGWPIAIVKDSGRLCDEIQNDHELLSKNPHVHVVDTPDQLRELLLTTQKQKRRETV